MKQYINFLLSRIPSENRNINLLGLRFIYLPHDNSKSSLFLNFLFSGKYFCKNQNQTLVTAYVNGDTNGMQRFF